ncbi:MAG: hypothetical protein JRI76_06450 [Deltaproteobacteria bacterium]|nr:hypothetical protein [Deltaproteobacteria bacterium]MBW2041663.1 hypothetical protein [Deltaproteobacteria bacterium]MBW2131121.1 hypothetical protein [Deltaproteobacteria bacterium]
MNVWIALMFYLIMVLFFLDVSRAEAYLDPGTGSMLVQGLLAAIAAAGVSLGVFWKRIKAFFRGSSRRKTEDNGEAHGD